MPGYITYEAAFPEDFIKSIHTAGYFQESLIRGVLPPTWWSNSGESCEARTFIFIIHIWSWNEMMSSRRLLCKRCRQQVEKGYNWQTNQELGMFPFSLWVTFSITYAKSHWLPCLFPRPFLYNTPDVFVLHLRSDMFSFKSMHVFPPAAARLCSHSA